jgi:cell division transport system ATP-binding protein
MVRFESVGLAYRHEGRHRAGRDSAPSTQILHDLNFEIAAGGFRWLTGASGAGKTSLLKLMYLAEHPSRGRISLFQTDISRVDRRTSSLLRRRIGVVYQDFRLLPHLSAYDNVALPLRLARKTEIRVRADVTELLRWVGLSGRLDSRPDELSGGEQQRVAIARAVVARPALLLADEPTGNLDDDQAQRLMLLITALNRLNTTVIVATHNTALIARHPAPVLELSAGRLIRHG